MCIKSWLRAGGLRKWMTGLIEWFDEPTVQQPVDGMGGGQAIASGELERDLFEDLAAAEPAGVEMRADLPVHQRVRTGCANVDHADLLRARLVFLQLLH